MELARNFIVMYSSKGKFSQFAVPGPAPFFRSDIFHQKSESSEVAELQTWVSILIDKVGSKMAFLSESPQCALIEFGNKVRNDRDIGTIIVLIVEIEKQDGTKHYWWASVPAFILRRFCGDLETLNRYFAKPLGDYVCREIRKEVNPAYVKKCTTFVTDAYQTPHEMNEPEFFTKIYINPLMFDGDGIPERMAMG